MPGGFSNPVTGGQGSLVRPAIKSPNYVAGVSGWSINRDGTAEFNGATFRGAVQIGGPLPNPEMLFTVSSGHPVMFMYTGDANETVPGQLQAVSGGGALTTSLIGATDYVGIPTDFPALVLRKNLASFADFIAQGDRVFFRTYVSAATRNRLHKPRRRTRRRGTDPLHNAVKRLPRRALLRDPLQLPRINRRRR
jgi:hypothetical protein